MYIKCDYIYTPQGIIKGYIQIENGIFKEILHSIPISEEFKYEYYSDKIIFPGFIDIHIHGYGRGSFGYKGDVDSIKKMSEDIINMGVTSFLPTSGTMPKDFLEKSYIAAKEAFETFEKGKGAEPLGIHMEGPFINEKYIGMQRLDSLQNPSIKIFDYYNNLCGNNIKLLTLAPELPGSLELIKYLKEKNVYTSAGHTAASFEEIKIAIEAGLTNFTHTYSGMKGFHHRDLGVVGAAMYFENTYAEVAKQTGITIRPEAFDILYRLKKDRRLIMMTDCLGLGGFPEGYTFYHYLRKTTFTIQNENLKLVRDNGDIEYISLNDYENLKDIEMGFLDSVKNVINRLDNGWLSVMKIACENPAKIAGVSHRKGSIEKNKDADFLVLNKNWELENIFCCGVKQRIKV